MIAFQRESLFEVIDEIEPLLQLHYEELCLNKDKVKLAPRWDQYIALEQADMLAIYTARQDGALIGYSVFFLQQHLHYSGLDVAINDILFLHPDHRGGTGLRFIKFCEKEIAAMKEPDAELKIVWRAKFDTVLADLLPKMGYRAEECAFGKIL